MPIVTAVMSTPNPLANKFMIDAPLFSGPPRHFSAGAHVVGDALGEDLLAVPGVVEVYCTGEFVTVTRDRGTPWSAIEAPVTALIEGHKAKRVIDIAGPSGVRTFTAQPAQPPTAQTMNSSSETWHGNPNSRASRATASSIGVGPQVNTVTCASVSGASCASQSRARSVT